MRYELQEYLQQLESQTSTGINQLQKILALFDEISQMGFALLQIEDAFEKDNLHYCQMREAYEQLWQALEAVLACNEAVYNDLERYLCTLQECDAPPSCFSLPPRNIILPQSLMVQEGEKEKMEAMPEETMARERKREEECTALTQEIFAAQACESEDIPDDDAPAKSQHRSFSSIVAYMPRFPRPSFFHRFSQSKRPPDAADDDCWKTEEDTDWSIDEGINWSNDKDTDWPSDEFFSLQRSYTSLPLEPTDWQNNDDDWGAAQASQIGDINNLADAHDTHIDTPEVPTAPPSLQKVQFSAVAPEQLRANRYGMVDVLMYEEAFRAEVDALLAKAKQPMQETKSGKHKVNEGASVTVHLQAAEGEWCDETQTQIWQGDYLTFRFAVRLPKPFIAPEALFTASVYLNNVIATTLTFVVQCDAAQPQQLQLTRQDIYSGFVSYASQDRAHVAMLVQGMQKARPDLDLFFDVESLRSGENWQEKLYHEIDRHDTLFLCWSRHAKQSKWVDREWRYTLKQKGVQAIEPIPLEPPECCPPPVELDGKHFNDIKLYIIHAPW